jgi:aryl-alcohol dehydrogenase-like predicted oxidoreductase
MNLSHAYGTPPDAAEAAKVLGRALDLGIRHFDTAALYGFGANEALLGRVLGSRRQSIVLASKCGMTGVGGKRVIDGRPETLLATLDEALRRLQTDFIDLYYLHRFDPRVPIDDGIGAMARMVEAGKLGALGLSEVSAETLRAAHAVHPIAAVQTEYSLWTRNAEIAVLDACRDIGAAFVAFSPLARGFLANPGLDPGRFADRDIRRGMPRFQAPHFERNRRLAAEFRKLADEAGCTMAQLALAWLLSRGDHVLPIPGTTSIAHLEENTAATSLQTDPALLARAGALINEQTVSGPRYPDSTQREIDTEEFADAAVQGTARG